MLEKLKEKLDSVFDVKSYGYVVDKRITRFAFAIITVLALFVILVDGSAFVRGDYWVECPADNVGACANPLYDPFNPGEHEEFLLPGESLGVKPSWLARNFAWISWSLFLGALLFNHFKNNKNWKVNIDEI